MAHQAGAYPCFSSLKDLEVFYSPLDWMLVHHKVTPRIKCTGAHLYTWVGEGAGTVSIKCLKEEHNTMSLARALTRITQSEDE